MDQENDRTIRLFHSVTIIQNAEGLEGSGTACVLGFLVARTVYYPHRSLAIWVCFRARYQVVSHYSWPPLDLQHVADLFSILYILNKLVDCRKNMEVCDMSSCGLLFHLYNCASAWENLHRFDVPSERLHRRRRSAPLIFRRAPNFFTKTLEWNLSMRCSDSQKWIRLYGFMVEMQSYNNVFPNVFIRCTLLAKLDFWVD